MATHYKGHRIQELLEQIHLLQNALDENRDSATKDDLIPMVESEATLAIMKAKLTALQGDER